MTIAMIKTTLAAPEFITPGRTGGGNESVRTGRLNRFDKGNPRPFRFDNRFGRTQYARRDGRLRPPASHRLRKINRARTAAGHQK